jgi:oxygen-dependent protoporphyrinogen oxidase
VERGAGGRLRVEVQGPGADGPLEVDAVVLAVPAPEVRRIAAPLLTGAEHRLLGGVRYDPAIAWIGAAAPLAVSVPTRVRVPRAAGAAISMVAVEPGRVRRAGIGAGRVTAIARPDWSGERLSSPDDVLAKELGAAVARWAPGAPEPEPGGLVRRWPEAWPRFDVGAYRALARLREVLVDRRRAGRRLYLAGDWLAAPTLEGAVSSGLRAASDLLADV